MAENLLPIINIAENQTLSIYWISCRAAGSSAAEEVPLKTIVVHFLRGIMILLHLSTLLVLLLPWSPSLVPKNHQVCNIHSCVFLYGTIISTALRPRPGADKRSCEIPSRLATRTMTIKWGRTDILKRFPRDDGATKMNSIVVISFHISQLLGICIEFFNDKEGN